MVELLENFERQVIELGCVFVPLHELDVTLDEQLEVRLTGQRQVLLGHRHHHQVFLNRSFSDNSRRLVASLA